MPQTTIINLPSTVYIHCLLLLEIINKVEGHNRYFKFHNCWVDNPTFQDTVTSCWEREVKGNNMWRFHRKFKKLSNTLSTWSKRNLVIFSKNLVSLKRRVKKLKKTWSWITVIRTERLYMNGMLTILDIPSPKYQNINIKK